MRLFNRGGHTDADRARQESSEAVRCSADRLQKSQDRWPEIANESGWHKLRLDQNHFAEEFRNLLEGKA